MRAKLDIRTNVILCPILSQRAPQMGAMRIGMKKTTEVILPASDWVNPNLVM